jgi:hypothetical protein
LIDHRREHPALRSERTNSPIFRMLPTLPEVNPASVAILPKDLAVEVERAKAAKAVDGSAKGSSRPLTVVRGQSWFRKDWARTDRS